MNKNITTSESYYSNSEEEKKNKIIDISDNEIKSSNSDNTKSISENDSIQNVSDNNNNQDISDNVNIKSVSDNDSIQNTSDNNNDHNIFNKDSIKNSTNDNLKNKKQYDSNELLNKAEYLFKRLKKAFTEMQLIWNFYDDDPSKEYVLAISLFDLIILKQKRNSKKFTKKFKECLMYLSLISIQKKKKKKKTVQSNQDRIEHLNYFALQRVNNNELLF